MSRLSDFYKTGKGDCAHTFDRGSARWLDVGSSRRESPVEYLAHLTNRAKRPKEDWFDAARRVARRALEKSEAIWPTYEEWQREIDYDPEEDGPIHEAYASWKRGYIDCATPRLAEWIMEELG
jgi:hypothetical protein